FRFLLLFFFFQAEDGIRDFHVTGVQTCALPILEHRLTSRALDTEAFRHPLAGSGIRPVTVDSWRKDLVYPTHCSFPNVPGRTGEIKPWKGQPNTACMPASQAAAASMARISLSRSDNPSAFADFTAASMVSIILLPMTTASAHSDNFFALSASRMPKPTPTGIFTWRRIRSSLRATSSVSRWPAPVTPLRDT